MKSKFLDTKVINMTITDTSNLLSPYSKESKPVISSEVAEFLDNCTNEFHPKEKLCLNITCSTLTDKEKEIYKHAIKNYYSNKLVDLIRNKKRKNIFGIICSSIGVIALALMFISNSLNTSKIITEYINIFAWVFIWEAVDILFIERGSFRFKILRLESLIKMQVTYIEKENAL